MSQLFDSAGNAFLTDVLAQNQAVGSLNAAVTSQLRGQSTVVVQVLTIGTQTLSFEATVDGTNFFAVNMYPVAGGSAVTTTTTNGQWIAVVAGFFQFRTRCSAYTSGSATVSQNVSQGTNEQALQIGTAQNAVSAGQNAVVVEGAVTTAPPTYVTGNASALSLSVPGGLRVGDPQNTASAGLPAPLVMGAVLTAAPAYTTANASALSLTTAGGLRTDWSSQGATAITAVPVAVGTGAPSGNAPVVNAAIFGGVSPAGGARAAAAPTGAILLGAIGQNTNPTSVASGQTVGIAADLAGRVITTPLNYRTLISHTGTTVSVNTISTIVAAGAAGVFRDITQLVVTTAGLVAQTLTFTDGTVSFILDYPNAAVAPGTPLIISFKDVPLRATSAATVWQVTQSLATACHYLVQFVERIA
jgi:hypothetical protein